jgi:hypothetical protein
MLHKTIGIYTHSIEQRKLPDITLKFEPIKDVKMKVMLNGNQIMETRREECGDWPEDKVKQNLIHVENYFADKKQYDQFKKEQCGVCAYPLIASLFGCKKYDSWAFEKKQLAYEFIDQVNQFNQRYRFSEEGSDLTYDQWEYDYSMKISCEFKEEREKLVNKILKRPETGLNPEDVVF